MMEPSTYSEAPTASSSPPPEATILPNEQELETLERILDAQQEIEAAVLASE